MRVPIRRVFVPTAHQRRSSCRVPAPVSIRGVSADERRPNVPVLAQWVAVTRSTAEYTDQIQARALDMRPSRRAFLLFAAALGIVLSLTMSQAPTESVAQRSASAAARPDLEGGWVRIDPEGSGSFGGLTSKFPRAVLTPAAAAIPVGRDPDDVDPDAKPHGPGRPPTSCRRGAVEVPVAAASSRIPPHCSSSRRTTRSC